MIHTLSESRVHERRFTRSSWLSLSVVVLMIAASAAMAALCLIQVGDGCVLEDGGTGARHGPSVVGACVGDWPTPLRPGDEIIAVANLPVQTRDVVYPLVAPAEWVDGGTAVYSLNRAGQSLDVPVPLHRMELGGILRAFGYGLRQQATGGFTIAFLGALVIFGLAPRVRAAQLLLVALGGLTAVTTLLWPGITVGMPFAGGPIYYLTVFLLHVWHCLFVPTILLLVMTFPRRVWPLTRQPHLTHALLYGLPNIAFALSVLTRRSTFAQAYLGLEALVAVLALLMITIHTFVRVRDPIIRAQTAWLTLGLAIGLMSIVLEWAVLSVLPGLVQSRDILPLLPLWTQVAIDTVFTLAFPACLGIAITRYHLFDIEIIVRRTLVYSALTGSLALIYVGGVALFQQLLRPLVGVQNDLAIVISTLAIAALFQPLRRRIQDFIDHRFYRGKYDATRTLSEFARTLKNEVDLENMSAAILTIVDRTVQPEHVSLWLRKPAHHKT